MKNKHRVFAAFCLLICALVSVPSAFSQRLSALGKPPDWRALDVFQGTISSGEFAVLLDTVFAPNGVWRETIELDDREARIRAPGWPGEKYILRFSPDPGQNQAAPRPWRRLAELPAPPANKPLSGLRVALDPGHIGGDYARMEGRWLKVGIADPVQEGDHALSVARLVAPRLAALGAEVSWARENNAPVTTQRPDDLRDFARSEMIAGGNPAPVENATGWDDPLRGQTVQAMSEHFFYRTSEIRARAHRVNAELRPDIVLCIHFNATSWGDPSAPIWAGTNHLHLLVNGDYSAGELRQDDARFEMLRRLLSRTHAEELALSEHAALALSRSSGLPAFRYTAGGAKAVGTTGFVWARNLLANRLYEAPVIFFEPWLMNESTTWERLLAGDYEGERLIAGDLRRSIYREYADGIVAGLLDAQAAAK